MVSRRDTEVLDLSKTSTICTKLADIPDKFTKSTIGAYFNKKVMLCGGWLAGKECGEYEFETNQWIDVPYSLNIERAEASGAILRNGSWMIIGGKRSDGEPLYSTEILKNGLFEPNLQWPEALSGHCVQSLNSSHTFVSGGESENGKLLGAVYFLNVDTSFWYSLEEKMMYKRRGHVCGIAKDVENGYIVIAGGENILKTEILDMRTMRFRQGPDLPFEMDWAASVQLDISFAIVGGEHLGYCSKPGMCIASNTLYEIDIQNNTWNMLNNQAMKFPRSKHIILGIDNEDNLCQDVCPSCQGELS